MSADDKVVIVVLCLLFVVPMLLQWAAWMFQTYLDHKKGGKDEERT